MCNFRVDLSDVSAETATLDACVAGTAREGAATGLEGVTGVVDSKVLEQQQRTGTRPSGAVPKVCCCSTRSSYIQRAYV